MFVEVFNLTDLDARLSLGFVAFDLHRVAIALVDRDLLRRSVPLDSLAQEPQRGFAIPFGGQQKIHCGCRRYRRPDTGTSMHPWPLAVLYQPCERARDSRGLLQRAVPRLQYRRDAFEANR